MTDLNIDGMALAPGIVETIASIAVKEVEGVAAIGSSNVSGFRSRFGAKPSKQGIDIVMNDNGQLHIAVRIDVYYGFVLPDLAAAVRAAVSDAVKSQVGVPVEAVDVFIDGIQFAD